MAPVVIIILLIASLFKLRSSEFQKKIFYQNYLTSIARLTLNNLFIIMIIIIIDVQNFLISNIYYIIAWTSPCLSLLHGETRTACYSIMSTKLTDNLSKIDAE